MKDARWREFRYKRNKTDADWVEYLSTHCDADGECKITRLPLDKDGYGQTKRGGKRRLAHRLLYTLLHGQPASGMVVMHTCDRPSCVNPAHLRLGTVADNNADRAAKKRSAYGLANGAYSQPHRVRRGEDNGSAKLREADALRILSTKGTVAASVLAEELGVCLSTINHIRSGRKWSHLAGHSHADIAPIFKDAPPNCILPQEWLPWTRPNREGE